MCDRVEFQLYLVGLAVCFKFCVIELSSVVGDDGPRDLELGDCILSNEPLDLLLGDGGQRLSLNPFGEIVDPDYKESLLPRSREKVQGGLCPIRRMAKRCLSE